jgi:hypothetical protein
MLEASTGKGLLENWKCLLACTLVSMSPFQYGKPCPASSRWDTTSSPSEHPSLTRLQVFGHPDPANPIGYNISPGRQQLISSLMILGAFISSSSAGFFATYLGRRQCLWAASALCCTANVIMMATTNLSGLYAGRFLIGLANGWYMTFSQLYIQVRTPRTLHRNRSYTDIIRTGINTSPLPRSNDIRFSMLDLPWLSSRDSDRQCNAQPPRQGLVPHPPGHHLHHPIVHVHRDVLHPRVATYVTPQYAVC